MNLRTAISSSVTVALALVSSAGCTRSVSQAQASGDEKATTERHTMEHHTTTPKSNIRHLSVVVKDVDRDEHRVTFEAKVSPEANIRSNGRPIKLDELNKGDAIRIAFDPATGEVVKTEVVRQARK